MPRLFVAATLPELITKRRQAELAAYSARLASTVPVEQWHLS